MKILSFRFQSKATRGKTNSTHRNSVPIPYQIRTKSHLYSEAIRGHGEVLQLSLLTIKPEMPGAAKGIKHPSLWEICRKPLRPKGEKAWLGSYPRRGKLHVARLRD